MTQEELDKQQQSAAAKGEPEFMDYASVADDDLDVITNMNMEADANADLAPLPKGVYLCKATFKESDKTKRWAKTPNFGGVGHHYRAEIIYEVVENPLNPPTSVRRRLFDNASTEVGASGTSRVMAILQASETFDSLKSKQRPNSHKAQAFALDEALESEPYVGVETDWVARKWNEAEKKFDFGPVKGMNAFPKDTAGNPLPYVVDPVQGRYGEVPAKNYIKKLHKPSTLGSTGNGDEETETEQQEAPAPPEVKHPHAMPTVQQPTAPAQAPQQAPQAPRPPQGPPVAGGVRRPPVTVKK